MPKYIVNHAIWLDKGRVTPGTVDEPTVVELESGRAAIAVKLGLLTPQPEAEAATEEDTAPLFRRRQKQKDTASS